MCSTLLLPAIRITLVSTNGDSLRVAAITGLGVLCEPSFIVHSAVEKKLLQPVLTQYKWFDASVYAVCPANRFLSLKSRRFIDFLADRFGPNPYWEAFLNSDPDS